MAAITPGSGATITASTIEAFFTGAIWLLQNLEADTTRNPTGINNVTSSISDDTRALTATINLSGTVDDDSGGKAVITCLDYLTTPSGGSAHWVVGTGGTITSATIQGAIFEACRLIDKLENNVVNNPTGKKLVNYSINNGDIGSSGNVSITINVANFPLTFSFNANGTQSLIGSSYLS